MKGKMLMLSAQLVMVSLFAIELIEELGHGIGSG